MATSNAAERILGRLPLWPLITLLIVTLCAAAFGWGLAAYSVPELLADGMRLAFEAVGLEPRWGRGLGGMVGFVLTPLAIVPLFPAIAALADRPGESPAASRLRVLDVLRVFWTTFLLQVVLVPWLLGDDAVIEVCAPVREVMWPLEVRFFAYGLVESHALLFVLTLATYVSFRRALRSEPAKPKGGAMDRVIAGALIGALAWEAVVLFVLPGAVRWWLPVSVCPDGALAAGEECGRAMARGLDVTLCSYPGEYVAALYGNIALSVGGGLWSWRRRLRQQGAPDA